MAWLYTCALTVVEVSLRDGEMELEYLMCVLWRTQLEPYPDKDLRNVLKRCYKKAKRMAKLLSTAVATTADADKNAVSQPSNESVIESLRQSTVNI